MNSSEEKSVLHFSRREMLGALATLSAGVVLPRIMKAQPNVLVNMEGDFYLPVRPEPKPNATEHLDEEGIVALERTLACPCPCTLDIYTCRTTDVTCANSPAIHRDVVRMNKGGYDGDEILAELTAVYGDRILMAPPKSGFNLVGWFFPAVAISTGAVAIAVLIRSWRQNAVTAAEVRASGVARSIGAQATPEEMARLSAALRDDSR